MAMQRSVQKTLAVRTEIEGHLRGLMERPEDVIDNITLLGTKRSTYPASVIKLRRQVAELAFNAKSPTLIDDLTKLIIKNF